MKTVEYLPNAQAEAALKDLEQAWAYYTPETQPEIKDEQPTQGYVAYYAAA